MAGGSEAHAWDAFFDARPAAADEAPEDEADQLRGGDLAPSSPGARRGADPAGPPDDERISHSLGRMILRYHVADYGLKVDPDGFVQVTDLLASCLEFEGASEGCLRRVAETSTGTRGRRFEVREDAEGGSMVRATYKHPKEGPRGRGGPRRDPHEPSRRRGGGGATASGGEGRAWASPRARRTTTAGTPRRLGQEDGAGAAVSSASRGDEAQESRGAACGGNAPSTASASASTAPGAEGEVQSEAPKQEVWERYYEPDSQRAWFWNVDTEEVFYADDPLSGWERFEDEGGNPWWWREADARFFIEEP
ncbi:unnamed protein product [Prorocentrum cordatum]|uniref:2'-phosphotransferase n=1 Tax=Prorocentrum cordatum TaxID=2364126 RepID=A0ABN9XKC0_9DINO|nr:unnamed protein product [Polarella glacialis]